MSEETIADADNVETQNMDGASSDMRDSITSGLVDDSSGDVQDNGSEGDDTSEASPYDVPIPEELRGEFPGNVKTIKDMMEYTRNLNRLKGKFSEKESTLQQQVDEMRKTLEGITNKSGPAGPTPEDILEGLATKPEETIRMLNRLEAEKLVNPLLEKISNLESKFQSDTNKNTLNSFVKTNNLTDDDIMALNEVMESRLQLYQSSPYFATPEDVLNDAYDLLTAKRSRETGVAAKKRANVITRTSGVVKDKKSGDGASREDALAALGFNR